MSNVTTMNRRKFCAAALASSGTASASLARANPVFPSKPVSLVVGFPPGGATDVTARVLQPHIQKFFDVPVIVENVSGASGSLGVQRVLSNPDGHAIYIGTASDTVLAPLSVASARYTAESLRLVSLLGVTDFAIAARSGLAANNLDELVGVARSAKPSLSYASFGNGTIYHLLGEQLRERLGADLLHVPLQGMGPTINGLVGGQVDLAFLPLAGQTLGFIANGRLKALGVMSAGRAESLPQVQSVNESPQLKGFVQNIWPGVFAPVSLDKEKVQRISQAVSVAMRSGEFVRSSQETGLSVPSPLLTPDEAQAFYVDQTAKLRALSKAANVQRN